MLIDSAPSDGWEFRPEISLIHPPCKLTCHRTFTQHSCKDNIRMQEILLSISLCHLSCFRSYARQDGMRLLCKNSPTPCVFCKSSSLSVNSAWAISGCCLRVNYRLNFSLLPCYSCLSCHKCLGRNWSAIIWTVMSSYFIALCLAFRETGSPPARVPLSLGFSSLERLSGSGWQWSPWLRRNNANN